MFQERIKQLEFQFDSQKKENEDLKYDNTLLYDKNIEKDAKLQAASEELDKLRRLLDNERNSQTVMDIA